MHGQEENPEGITESRLQYIACSCEHLSRIGVFMFRFLRFLSENDVLRTYSKAFGYKLSSMLPDLPSGVWGLRNCNNPCNVSLVNLMELCLHIYTYMFFLTVGTSICNATIFKRYINRFF